MSQAGDVVRVARARSRVSQADVARRAGTTQAAISRIESGREDPTVGRLARILAAMGWRMAIDLEPVNPRPRASRRSGAPRPRPR